MGGQKNQKLDNDIEALPYALLMQRHVLHKNFRDAMTMLIAWKRTPPATPMDKRRDEIRNYLRIVIDEIALEAQSGGVANSDRRAKKFAVHPEMKEYFNILNNAIDTQIKSPKTKGWAKACRIDLTDPAIITRLKESYAGRAEDLTWDSKLYPDTLIKNAESSEGMIEAIDYASKIILTEIVRDESVFAGLFPRKEKPIPPSFRF